MCTLKDKLCGLIIEFSLRGKEKKTHQASASYKTNALKICQPGFRDKVKGSVLIVESVKEERKSSCALSLPHIKILIQLRSVICMAPCISFS